MTCSVVSDVSRREASDVIYICRGNDFSPSSCRAAEASSVYFTGRGLRQLHTSTWVTETSPHAEREEQVEADKKHDDKITTFLTPTRKHLVLDRKSGSVTDWPDIRHTGWCSPPDRTGFRTTNMLNILRFFRFRTHFQVVTTLCFMLCWGSRTETTCQGPENITVRLQILGSVTTNMAWIVPTARVPVV